MKGMSFSSCSSFELSSIKPMNSHTSNCRFVELIVSCVDRHWDIDY